MQKKFISNLILLALLNLVIKPVAIFGIDVTVQNRVGSEDYGLYFSLLNFTYLFNILLTLLNTIKKISMKETKIDILHVAFQSFYFQLP